MIDDIVSCFFMYQERYSGVTGNYQDHGFCFPPDMESDGKLYIFSMGAYDCSLHRIRSLH